MDSYSQNIKDVLASIESGKISPKKGYEMIQVIRGKSNQNKEHIIETIENNHREHNAYRAMVLTNPGGTDQIETIAVEPVEPGYGKVQVIMKSCSLNFADLLCVKGMYPNMPEYPFTPGFEFSGIVSKVGAGVKKVKPGDGVICLTDHHLGGHTLIRTLHEELVYKKPDNVSYEEACAFPVAFLTSHHTLELARIKKGDKVLIHTAAGGCGHIAVQMAMAQGAEVYATCGSYEKILFLQELGVKYCINYLESDFEYEIQKLTHNYGVDVVVNTLAQDGIQKGLNILASGGRYIEIAMVGLKASTGFDLSNLMDNQSFHSVDLRSIMKNQPILWESYVDIMLKTLEQRKLKITISLTKPFSQLKEAYQYMEQRRNIGKIVVNTNLSDAYIQSQVEQLSSDVCHNQTQLASSEDYNPLDIAVIGLSCRYAGANNTQEFWNNLVTGVCSIDEVPSSRWDKNIYYDKDVHKTHKTNCKWGGFLKDIDQFDPLFFNMSGREAELTDPQQRLFLEEAWKALEDAGYANEQQADNKVGVFLGVGFGDYQSLLLQEGTAPEAQSFWGNSCSVSAARISYFLNLKGPSLAIDTACSSSLVAIHLGCQSIVSGDSDMVIAGGVFMAIQPNFYIMCSNAGMLSPTGECRTFDSQANGFVPGEGVGAIVLKPLHNAMRDGDNIYGVIKGTAINQDGKTNGLTAPSTLSQSEVEATVYDKYQIDPDSIDYIEAHGTGTNLGDPIEIEALNHTYRKYTDKTQYCAIGSVKTNIGHTSMAAGVAGVIKVLLALKNEKIPPSLNYNENNPYIDFEKSPFYVNTQLLKWEKTNTKIRRAAVSSFGFSGTNAHMVIEESPEDRMPHNIQKTCYLIPLSAKTQEALDNKVVELYKWLTQEGHKNSFHHIAYTLQVGRAQFKYRCAFIVKDGVELQQAMSTVMHGGDTLHYIKQQKVIQSKSSKGMYKNMLEIIHKLKCENEFSHPCYDYALASKQSHVTKHEEGNELTYKKIIEDLATLYIEGCQIDWKEMYKLGEGRIISMPVYPFAQERYWVPALEENSQLDLEPITDDDQIIGMFNRLRNGDMDIDTIDKLIGGH